MKNSKIKEWVNESFNNTLEGLIAEIEKGNLTWEKMWNSILTAQNNLVSKKDYRGVNQFILSLTALNKGYTSNVWLTYKQAKLKKTYIEKSELKNSTMVIYYQMFSKTDTNGKPVLNASGNAVTIPMLRYYKVYNVAQTVGYVAQSVEVNNDNQIFSIDAVEEFIKSYSELPKITSGEPSYVPDMDVIRMPAKESFKSIEEYYGAFFHELAHSTGNIKRLNRLENTGFGSTSYAKEELVAEITANAILSFLGINTKKSSKNSSAYLKNWLGRFKANADYLFTSGKKSIEAIEYIMNHR